VRYNWIDSLKGFGVILVILGHLPTSPDLHKYIFSFHMPLFFFISGYLFNQKKYLQAGKFITSRVRSLLFPYFSLTFVSYLIFMLTNYSPSQGRFFLPYEGNLSKTIYSTLYASFNFEHSYSVIFNGPLWFLPCLFVTSIFFYVLFKAFNKSLYSFIEAIVIVSLIGYSSINYLPQALPWSIDIALSAVTFYSAGYLFRNYFQEEFFKVAKIIITPLILISLSSIYTDITDLNLWKFSENYLTFYLIAFSGIFSYMYIFSRIRSSRFLEYYGKNSLIVFGLHFPIFGIIDYAVNVITMTFGLHTPQGSLLFSIVKTFLVLALVLPFTFAASRFSKAEKTTENMSTTRGLS
jgi:fucose 4-O-acetylase-like acetyltransferase